MKWAFVWGVSLCVWREKRQIWLEMQSLVHRLPTQSPVSPFSALRIHTQHASCAWRTTMGIKGLTKLLADNAPNAMKEQKFESYFGRKIAIDASMSIYQFLAPSEAEAECAALCKYDKVYAVASEDMDSLTFGAPRFLRHLMEPTSRKLPVMEFEIAKVLEGLDLTMDQFVDMCILCGCDYCDTIKGIGAQTALKLVRQHGNIEAILVNLNKDRYQIPDNWPFQEARRLFKEPFVNTMENLPEFKWTAPDEENLKKFLVEENGFNHDRVVKAVERIKAAKNKSSQGRLESFFKPNAGLDTTPKRKEADDSQKSKSVLSKKSKSTSGHAKGRKK